MEIINEYTLSLTITDTWFRSIGKEEYILDINLIEYIDICFNVEILTILNSVESEYWQEQVTYNEILYTVQSLIEES